MVGACSVVGACDTASTCGTVGMHSMADAHSTTGARGAPRVGDTAGTHDMRPKQKWVLGHMVGHVDSPQRKARAVSPCSAESMHRTTGMHGTAGVCGMVGVCSPAGTCGMTGAHNTREPWTKWVPRHMIGHKDTLQEMGRPEPPRDGGNIDLQDAEDLNR